MEHIFWDGFERYLETVQLGKQTLEISEHLVVRECIIAWLFCAQLGFSAYLASFSYVWLLLASLHTVQNQWERSGWYDHLLYTVYCIHPFCMNFYGHSVESIFLFSQKWSFIHHVSPPLDETPMKRKILWFLWSNIKVSILVILGMWEAFASAVSWQPLLSQRKQGCRKLFGSLINMEKVLLHSSLSRRTWMAAKWEWGSVFFSIGWMLSRRDWKGLPRSLFVWL